MKSLGSIRWIRVGHAGRRLLGARRKIGRQQRQCRHDADEALLHDFLNFRGGTLTFHARPRQGSPGNRGRARTAPRPPRHNAPMKRAACATWCLLALAAEAILGAQQPAAPDPVIVGAGDIADCKALGPAARTANLLEKIDGTVFTLGDDAYENGSPKQFADCYGPTWGRFKARTRPVVGNHEYGTAFAAGYFDYFGAAAGDRTKGYYSYDLGKWHLVVINSNCAQVGGCHAGSPQEQWLRQDLAAHPAPCTVAMWHHPRYSSGEHGDDRSMRDIWQALYDADADVVLSGHDHDYERFAPAGRRQQVGPGARHPPVRRRHGRPRPLQVGAQGHRQRGQEQRDVRRSEDDAPRRRLRLGVHPGRGPDLHRQGQREVPLSRDER